MTLQIRRNKIIELILISKVLGINSQEILTIKVAVFRVAMTLTAYNKRKFDVTSSKD